MRLGSESPDNACVATYPGGVPQRPGRWPARQLPATFKRSISIDPTVLLPEV